MGFNLKGNQVVFTKGAKPQSIKEAQREVCAIYKTLCAIKAPRGGANASAAYLLTLDRDYWSALKEVSPWYPALLASASRAYSAMGDTLSTKPIYHMNVFFALQDLDKIRDLSAPLLSALESSGQQEFMFMAKET